MLPLMFIFSIPLNGLIGSKKKRVRTGAFPQVNWIFLGAIFVNLLFPQASAMGSTPNPVSLNLSSIVKLQSDLDLKNKSVGLALEGVGENMLLAGVLPVSSVYFFTPTYYGFPQTKISVSPDYLVVSSLKIQTSKFCSGEKYISNSLSIVSRIGSPNCYSSLLRMLNPK
jgi:hypothetical protein